MEPHLKARTASSEYCCSNTFPLLAFVNMVLRQQTYGEDIWKWEKRPGWYESWQIFPSVSLPPCHTLKQISLFNFLFIFCSLSLLLFLIIASDLNWRLCNDLPITHTHWFLNINWRMLYILLYVFIFSLKPLTWRLFQSLPCSFVLQKIISGSALPFFLSNIQRSCFLA